MQVETLSIRLSKAERTALRLAAKKQNLSQGEIVRNALKAYGVAPEVPAPPSAYELVKHLLGRQSGGPSDLSTNNKYMEGFGR
ncbi:MAG: hypothetical protein IPL39_16845 [Opitutaceae bacterium]|nr:hypothetical protein [Opitutaceae bacterium]